MSDDAFHGRDLAVTTQNVPGISLEGRAGWFLDFPWSLIAPNLGIGGCPRPVRSCRCGHLQCDAPGTGWSVTLCPIAPHSKRDDAHEAAMFWPGGWASWHGETRGDVEQKLHDALLAMLAPVPKVYLLPMRWLDENDEQVYDARLVSMAHERVVSTGPTRSVSVEADAVSAVRAALELFKKPARVVICVGERFFPTFKRLYCAASARRSNPSPADSMRQLAQKHAVHLRSGAPEDVLALARGQK